MSRRTPALVAAGLLLLTGCGDRPGYDHTAVERYLVHSQAGTFGAAGDHARASCPTARDLTEGMSLTCTLSVSGAKLPYRVRLTHVRADRVTVAARPDGVLVSGAKLRHYVRTTLPASATGADVDCGGPYVVADVGSSVHCTLTLGSQQKPITVKVLDAAGRVSISS